VHPRLEKLRKYTPSLDRELYPTGWVSRHSDLLAKRRTLRRPALIPPLLKELLLPKLLASPFELPVPAGISPLPGRITLQRMASLGVTPPGGVGSGNSQGRAPSEGRG
jgi:hypothetical protein